MATTATVWQPTTVINSGITTGLQTDPVAVETADGRIFTLWADDTNNVEEAAGRDVVGRHRDYYLGLDQPFHVNLNVSAGNESGARVAALPDGGLFTVFHSTANGNDVYYIRHDADGNVVSSGSIAVGANNYNRPSITLLGNNTLAIGYTSNGTANNYGVVTFDLATNAIGPRLTFDDPIGPNTGGTSIEMAALGGGRWVAVYAAELTPVAPPFDILELRVRVYDSSGSVAEFTIPDSENASSLQVTSVLGGGFAVAYEDFPDHDFYVRRYDGNGSAIGGAIDLELPVGAFGTTLHDIVGLKEGGFYVVYESGLTGALAGQRYSSTGVAIGTANSLSTGGADQARLALTQDGRIVVSWGIGGNILQTILDPRDEGLAIVGNETDEILSARLEGSWVLGGGGSDTLLGWHGADRLEGGIGADILKGGSGADILDGGTSQDILEGGTGNDTYILGRPDVTIGGGAAILDILVEQPGGGTDTVEVEFHDIPIGGDFAFFFESYTLPDNFENGIVTGSDFFQLIGNGLGNQLRGNNAANFLDGGAGNDTLTGGGGNDRLDGGTGTDTASYAGALGGGVRVNLALAGQQAVGADQGSDTLINVERLIGSNQSDVLVGDGGVNVLAGGSGDDHLKGGGGVDQLRGNEGNDLYTVDVAGEAIEASNQGTDAVRSTVSYTLGANLENLTLLGSDNLSGTGNGLANGLTGNTGNNRLTGGLGQDVMSGNDGEDRFDFNRLEDSGVTAQTRDSVTDFATGTAATHIDRIDVSTIDANADLAGNQAFLFGGAFAAGHIRALQAGANVVLQFNTDADAQAEMTLQLDDVLAGNLDAGDFFL